VELVLLDPLGQEDPRGLVEDQDQQEALDLKVNQVHVEIGEKQDRLVPLGIQAHLDPLAHLGLLDPLVRKDS
jgi:hypothetical protein